MGQKTSSIPYAKPVIRAAAYGRHSSKNQNPTSAAEQIRLIKSLHKKETLPFIKHVQSQYEVQITDEWTLMDEALPGRTTVGRAGYDRLLRGIENGDFDVVIVDNLSRLCRDLGDQIHLYDLVKYKKIELISVGENISSESPNARMYFIVKGMVNELSNETHAQQTKRGQSVRVIEGFSAGDICYGFNSTPTRTRFKGGLEVPSHYKIEIDEEQARGVRLIYQLRLRELGLSAIAKYLNKNEVPSPPRSQKITGKKCNWSPNTIRKILMSPKYIGRWTWGKQTNIKNPTTKKIERRSQGREHWLEHYDGASIREDLVIIDIQTWEQVQKTFTPRTAKPKNESKDKWADARSEKTSGNKADILLGGILKCGQCGGNMLQVTKRRGGYMGCYVHYRKDPVKCSNNRTISRKKIEGAVIDQLKKILMDEHNVNLATKLINQKIKERLNTAPSEIRSLMKQKHEVEREVRNFIKFIRERGDLSETARVELADAERRQRFISDRLKALEVAKIDKLLVTPFAVRERFEKLAELFATDLTLANGALRKFIPAKLTCTSLAESSGKNLNQFSSKWHVEGEIALGPTDLATSEIVKTSDFSVALRVNI